MGLAASAITIRIDTLSAAVKRAGRVCSKK